MKAISPVLFVSGALALTALGAPSLHAEKPDIATLRSWPVSQDGTVVFSNSFDGGDLNRLREPLRNGFSLVRGQGVNGTDAIQYTRDDAEQYAVWGIELPPLAPEQTYTLRFMMRGENLQLRGDQARPSRYFAVEYIRDGKFFDGDYPGVEPPGDEWQPYEFTIRPRAGARSFVTFYLQQHATGTIWFDDLQVVASGENNTVILARPTHRTFRQGDGRFTLHSDQRRHKPLAVIATLTQEDHQQEQLIFSENARYHSDFGDMRLGLAEIRAELYDLETRTRLAEDRFQMYVRPEEAPPAHHVYLDEHHRTMVAGEPFLPIGIYSYQGLRPYDLQRLQEAGFNTILEAGGIYLRGREELSDPIANVRAGLDLAQSYGMKVIFSLKDQMTHARWAVREWAGAEGIFEVAEKAVASVSDHPAILSYFISDEAPFSDAPDILRLRDIVAQHDPWRPTYGLTHQMGEMPRYGITSDIVGADPYPFSHKETPDPTLERVLVCMEGVNATGQPYWITPQIFSFGAYKATTKEEFDAFREPTPEELIAMPLLSVIEGAKGFMFYSYTSIFSRSEKLSPGYTQQHWPKVVAVVDILRQLEPFILSTRPAPAVEIQQVAGGRVYARSFETEDQRLAVVIVANAGPAEALLTLPTSRDLRSVYSNTESLGAGRYRFKVEAIDSDVLFLD